MALKLMYITNDINIARIAESAGVDRIFVDLEYIGKSKRQGGMDTVQSKHSVSDIEKLKAAIQCELLVRCNPIHCASEEYGSSQDEINDIVEAGADIIMLPYFKTIEEVKLFINYVSGRVKTMLLVETPEAVNIIDEILNLKGIDEIFIGLNDLSLGYNKKFMFELLTDGTVEVLCKKFKEKDIPYGFGGIAALGKGLLPAEYVIAEHYRLESTRAILARSFYDTRVSNDIEKVKNIFTKGLDEIRKYEEYCSNQSNVFFKNNKEVLEQKVKSIVEE